MRVVVFAFSCSPYAGSEPNYGFNLPLGLATAGLDVCCLTDARNREKIETEMAINPMPNLTFEYVAVEGFWEKRYTSQLGLYAFYLTWQQLAAKRGRQLHAQHAFDVGHHITWGSFQMGSGLAYLGIPFVYGPLGGGQFALPMFKEYFGKGWKTEVMRKLVSNALVAFNPMLKKTVRSKKVVVLATNAETLSLAKRVGAKRVLPLADPALPQSFWKESIPERIKTDGELKLVWCGRLAPRKGLKFTLMALAQVDASIPWHLTVLGDGPQAADLKDWIAEYNLQARVTWKGSIPWVEMNAEYAAADAFILTSLRESTAVQFLEAMAYGLPIFTLNMHGASVFVPADAGYKIDVSNPSQIASNLAKAVGEHYHHPERWQAMADAGRKTAYQYMWPQKITYFINLYAQHITDVGTKV
jgi:glycosyltransferase involved in cell wall biosynthesis